MRTDSIVSTVLRVRGLFSPALFQALSDHQCIARWASTLGHHGGGGNARHRSPARWAPRAESDLGCPAPGRRVGRASGLPRDVAHASSCQGRGAPPTATNGALGGVRTLRACAGQKTFCCLPRRPERAMTDPNAYAASVLDDPLESEVRATRAALSAATGDDLARIAATHRTLETSERAAGRKIVTPPARPSAAA